MALIKGDDKATAEYTKRKTAALRKSAPKRRRDSRAKAQENAGPIDTTGSDKAKRQPTGG